MASRKLSAHGAMSRGGSKLNISLSLCLFPFPFLFHSNVVLGNFSPLFYIDFYRFHRTKAIDILYTFLRINRLYTRECLKYCIFFHFYHFERF